jgi:GGDEF domain-containing protein
MLFQHPVYPLIMAVFIVVLVIVQSIQSERVLKNRFVLASLTLTISVMVFVMFYQNDLLKENGPWRDAYIGFTFFTYALFLLMFYGAFRIAIMKANHYQLFLKGIRNSKLNAYYIVDKRERIRDMSQSILDELGLEKEDVIGKKLFSVFNKTIRFTRMNGSETDNKTLEALYAGYRKTARPGDYEETELFFNNHEGSQVILHMVVQPLFVMGKYRGRINVGEAKTDFDMLSVEKELKERNDELESIRHKFVATLDISEEGLFTIDLDDRTIWASDALVSSLKLPSNLMDLTDFRRLIDAEDFKKYHDVIESLTIGKSTYQTSYRIMSDGQPKWFRETGKRIFEDPNTNVIMGTLNPLKTRHYMASDIDALDGLPDHNNLIVDMTKLIANNRYFQIVLFELTNLPGVNESHGREVGNLLMAEYIRNLKDAFVTERGDIYRITGIRFAMLVTDPRKIETLNAGIRSNKTYLDFDMRYGSIHAELEVHAGVAISGTDQFDAHKLHEAASQALHVAKNPKFDGHACFYKDIRS